MGTYRPLYSLRVEHDYYDNLACRALAFRLKAGGVDLCRRRGLLFRQTAVNEWTLLYDCDSAGVDTSSDKVEAELCITDPAFVLFTEKLQRFFTADFFAHDRNVFLYDLWKCGSHEQRRPCIGGH